MQLFTTLEGYSNMKTAEMKKPMSTPMIALAVLAGAAAVAVAMTKTDWKKTVLGDAAPA